MTIFRQLATFSFTTRTAENIQQQFGRAQEVCRALQQNILKKQPDNVAIWTKNSFYDFIILFDRFLIADRSKEIKNGAVKNGSKGR